MNDIERVHSGNRRCIDDVLEVEFLASECNGTELNIMSVIVVALLNLLNSQVYAQETEWSPRSPYSQQQG